MTRKESELKEEKREEKVVRVSQILLFTLQNLEVKAWAYLGLISHPENKSIAKDLDEAKLAIDALDALYNVMKDRMMPEEKSHYELVLTNLKLNYVKETPS